MKHKEISVPLYLLDLAEDNPKGQIHGIYKSGLKASLDYFDICDRLKVWPNPKAKGRYIILNGNQRYPLIIEKKKHEILCSHFGLDPLDEYSEDPVKSKEYKTRLKSVMADPANMQLLQNFEVRAKQELVDVQVMDLDKEDAKLFMAAFDRNRAKTDEAKIVHNIIDEVKSKNNILINKMVRPDKGFIQVLPKSSPVHVPQVAPTLANPVTPPPEEPKPKQQEIDFGKWGPPPSQPQESTAPPLQPLIPFTVSLTREGYKEITERILRCSARIFRENQIKMALTQLEESMGDEPLETDSIIVEIALMTLNRHNLKKS